MATLDRKVLDFFSPHYTGIKTAADFWGRAGNYIAKDSKIEGILKDAEPGDKEAVLNRLEAITNKNFEQYGAQYFTGRSKLSTLARYAGLGASGIGAITAAGGIFALAAGGPITAIAAVGYGLGWVLAGGLANVGADLYDAARMQKALQEKDEERGFLGYVKRTAKGAWNAVTAPFRKESWKPIAEGLAINAITHQGAGILGRYLAPALGGALPYAQVATLGASAIAFYRGGKKFEDVVINYIKDRSIEQLLAERGEVRLPEDSSNVIPLKYRFRTIGDDPSMGYALQHHAANDHAYQALRQPGADGLGYVGPRQEMRDAA